MSNQPNSAEVADLITLLSGQSDDRFSEALADCIMDPVPEEVAAFRSPELAARSYAAARYLIDHANTTMRTRAGEEASNKDLRRRTEAFRNKVGRERRILEELVRSLELQRGMIRSSPNPRARAARRLKQLHLAEYQELVREETEKLAEERREARRQAKAASRAARNGVRVSDR